MSKNIAIASKLGNKYLCLENDTCCDVKNCKKIKWNEKVMNINNNIGFDCKEYKYDRTVINIHSGEIFIHYKLVVGQKLCDKDKVISTSLLS